MKLSLSRSIMLALASGAVSLVTVNPSSLQAQSLPYRVEDLGVLAGGGSPTAINATGQVVGWSGSNPARAFVFTDGVGMVELVGPGGRSNSIARDINDAGIIVGEAWGGGTSYHAVRWTGDVGEDLGALSTSSRALGINLDGVVVGDTPVDALDSKAFVFNDPGGMALLVPLNFASHASGINPVGQVTGGMTVGNAYHAYRFTPEVGIEDLGIVPGFLGSFGGAINVSGQVAGSLTSATGNTQRLFRFTDGIGMVELGGFGEENGVSGMNARGDFVGRGRPMTGILRAFLYTDEDGLQDLERLVDWPSPGYRLLYANGINDAGQILGVAFNHNDGRWHIVRLTPKTPVGPLAALSVTPARVEAGGTCMGWVTITQPAPSGGAVVELTSGDPGVVNVPGSVAIAEGQRHASFAAATLSVGSVTTIQVTASYQGQLRAATVEVIPAAPTDVGGQPEVPFIVRVAAPGPNPARRSAVIPYELSRSSYVRLRLYDVAGRIVRTLVDSPQAPGLYPVLWDGRNDAGGTVPSGAYFYRIHVGAFQCGGKLVFVR